MLRTASRGAWVLALRSQTLARAVPQAGLDVVPGFVREAQACCILHAPGMGRWASSCSPSPPAPRTEEEERASGEIDRRLGEAASSGGAEGVAKLVDAEGGGFSEANVARAFRAFAETLKPGADFTAVSKHPGFQVLIGESMGCMMTHGPGRASCMPGWRSIIWPMQAEATFTQVCRTLAHWRR